MALGNLGVGVVCTNISTLTCADAIGILIDSKPTMQAAITSNSDVSIPASLADHVSLLVLEPWERDDAMVKDLQTGDILDINPSQDTIAPNDVSDPSKVTHAITWLWLGRFGKAATGD
ncbi:hypothetical protein EP7_002606 [Isosphaeraceae bacterium EP7]